MYDNTIISGYDYWASYLVNGDSSGLEAEELAECKAWLDHHGMGAGDCIGVCDGEPSFTWPDGPFELRGNCVDYIFWCRK